MIEKYNTIVNKIVRSFCTRYYREIYEEQMDDISYKYYVDLMDYKGIFQGPVNINDEYYNLDDIILAEHLQIPCKCVQDYNTREYERYQEGIKKDCNLYHYWMTKWKK